MKKVIYLIVLILFFCTNENILAKNLSFFLSGGFTNGIKTYNSRYEWKWNDTERQAYKVSEVGNIMLNNPSGQYYSAGLTYLFLKNFGISLSVGFFSKKMQLNSNYSFKIDWWDKDSWQFDGNWVNTGTKSSIPISADLVYSANISDSYSYSVFAGLTIFFTRLDLPTNIGWGGILHDTQGVDQYIPDWFEIDIEINRKITEYGGNIGIALDRKINKTLSIFLSSQYFLSSEKYYRWEVISKGIYGYEGKLGALRSYEDPNIHSINGEIKTRFNYRFFNLMIGLKLSFGSTGYQK